MSIHKILQLVNGDQKEERAKRQHGRHTETNDDDRGVGDQVADHRQKPRYEGHCNQSLRQRKLDAQQRHQAQQIQTCQSGVQAEILT